MNPADVLADAIARLRSAGHEIERCDWPPDPLPPLFVVDGRELTANQVIHLATATPSAGVPERSISPGVGEYPFPRLRLRR